MLFGIVLGCLTITRMGDVWGRKPIYFFGLLIHIIVTCVIVFAKNVIVGYIMLGAMGYSLTMRYYIGYTYNVEMQPKSHAILASTIQFMFESVCYLFICLYFLTISKDWRYLMIPNVTFSLFGMISLSLMPESPRFLVSKKRFD